MKKATFSWVLFLSFASAFMVWGTPSTTPKLPPIAIHRYISMPRINPLAQQTVEWNHILKGKQTYQTGLIHYNDQGVEYSLFVPHGIDFSKPIPMIVALHGSNNTARQYIGCWINTAKEENMIVLCPESTLSRKWHPQDENKILNLIQNILEKYPINSKRILLSGFSGGAHFTYYLGMNHPDVFVGIAPICGKVINAWEKEIHLNHPQKIPIFAINSDQDSIVWPEEAINSWDVLKTYNYPITTWMVHGMPHQHYPLLNSIIINWFNSLSQQKS